MADLAVNTCKGSYDMGSKTLLTYAYTCEAALPATETVASSCSQDTIACSCRDDYIGGPTR